MKCSECPEGLELTFKGCVSLVEQEIEMKNLCLKINCNYPGAYCAVEEGGDAKCICETIHCDESKIGVVVCGNDGQTYASECDLMKFACDNQNEIHVAYVGKCSQGKEFTKILELARISVEIPVFALYIKTDNIKEIKLISKSHFFILFSWYC